MSASVIVRDLGGNVGADHLGYEVLVSRISIDNSGDVGQQPSHLFCGMRNIHH